MLGVWVHIESSSLVRLQM